MTVLGSAPVPEVYPRPGQFSRRIDRRVVLLALAAAAASGASAIVVGVWAPVVVAAIGLMTLTAFRPVTASYIYFAALPFTAGIERGQALPMLRPNEALLVLLVGGALVGAYVRFLRGDSVDLRFGPLDLPLAVFVVAFTLWPVVSLMLRGRSPDSGELAALLPVVKLAGLLLLVRKRKARAG